MNDVSLRIRVVDDGDFDAAHEIAGTIDDLDLTSSTGSPSGDFEGMVEPVTALLLAAGATAAVKFVMDWWERRRGGLVIDQRPDRVDDIYRDQDVPYGFVIIYPPDNGAVQVEAKDMPKDAMERLLETVITGGMKSAAEVAKLAAAAAGNANVKEVPA